MEAYLSVPVNRIKLFQDLVKQHDLRFKGNPFVCGEKAWVTVSSDHLSPGASNEFFSDWSRFNTQIREVKSPKWKKIVRHTLISLFNIKRKA
jgi:hypothetical protein